MEQMGRDQIKGQTALLSTSHIGKILNAYSVSGITSSRQVAPRTEANKLVAPKMRKPFGSKNGKKVNHKMHYYQKQTLGRCFMCIIGHPPEFGTFRMNCGNIARVISTHFVLVPTRSGKVDI